MKRAAVLVPLSLFVVACATTPALQTPSGKPEVTISNATPTEIIDHLANNAVNSGWAIRDRAERKLVIARENDSVLNRLLVGSDAGTSPEDRITFDIVGSSASWRVLGSKHLVGRPGTPFENRVDVSRSAVNLQQELDRLRASIAQGK